MSKRKVEYRRAQRLFHRLMSAYATPPEMTVSQWADQYRVLSPEASAERGRWRTDRAPYQREIMDAVGDPRVERVVVKSSAQVGKTEILLNTIGYFMDYDPAPMMYIQPTEGMAESFSKDRLSPMIRDCPVLSGKILDTSDKRKGNTTFHKSFPGGHITMIGANAPSKLASRPIRVLLLDEVDRFPVSAGREGDPIALAVKRTTTFWNRKILEVSTPTIKGDSQIDKDFDKSTAEELEVACPQCGAYQEYAWEQLKFDHESGTEEAHVLGFVCKECGVLSKEASWKRQPIRWKAKYPGRKWRGFHLNELASPWKRWDEIVEDFLRAKHDGPEAMKVWHNTALGLSGETLTTVILDFNHDDASDGSGKVPMSFGLKELMANKRGWSQVYGGRWYGYLDSGIPDYLSNTVIPGLPESLQGFLKTVNKTYDKASTTKISIPTLKEVNGTGVMTNGSDRPTGGGYQYPYFATTQKRIKRLANGSGAVAEWYVASNHGGNTGYYPVAINEAGESEWATSGNYGICFCFYI